MWTFLEIFADIIKLKWSWSPPAPTQSPTVCPAMSSLLSCPQTFWSICLSGFSHPHTTPCWGHPLHPCQFPKTTCSIGSQCYLSHSPQTTLNRQTPSPSPSSCFLNVTWRHLETSLTRWLTGSWVLELLRGTPGSHSNWVDGLLISRENSASCSRQRKSYFPPAITGRIHICPKRKGYWMSGGDCTGKCPAFSAGPPHELCALE